MNAAGRTSRPLRKSPVRARTGSLRGRAIGMLAVVTACAPSESHDVHAGSTASGLFYEVSGGGPPVVLIHAFSVDRRMWDEQIRHLEPAYRVVRYDLRGHGRSAAPQGPYAAYEDLAEVMDAVGVERASLLGLSAGAQIAVDFALEHPERVVGLALASPGLSGYAVADPMPWFDPVIEAVRAGDAQEAARRWAASPLMAVPGDDAAAARVEELAVANARIWSDPANPEVPLSPPAIGRLPELDVPTLVVLGADDLPYVADIGDVLATCVRGARTLVIDGAGHLVSLAAPAAFNEAVTAFLAEDGVPEPLGHVPDPRCPSTPA